MKHYKKIILTLALLLTAVTGAWAQNAPTTYPFPITWDATNKTTGFNLPAGNVFMTVEYYPAAAVATAPAAKSDIKATTADAIVEAGTVAKIGETENAQGTLMYYAVQSETAPEAPDYDNQGWSDKVPTAADFNQGNVYVWYYVKGADGDETSTFNDGAITKLGESGYVTLAAAPTYAITLKEDTEEADKWTISPAEATKGTTITATYTGTKKVIGMTVTKRVSLVYPIVISEVTDEAYIGSVVAADGYVYATVAAAKAASKTPVAMIAYVGTASNCTHGLAIALADESGTKDFWAAVTACSGKAAVTGGTWRLPSEKDWQYMFIGCGSSESYSAPTIGMSKSFSGLASKLTTAQGDALQTSTSYYWSSTKYSLSNAWLVFFDGSSAFFYGDYDDQEFSVRACLAF